MQVHIEVPIGELADRISILQIKMEKIHQEEKLKHVSLDLSQLLGVLYNLRVAKFCSRCNKIQSGAWDQLTQLAGELRSLNLKIWDIEDKIRSLEKSQDFGPEFIATARAVYFTNDERAAVKKKINDLFGSDISEEKSYTNYAPSTNS